MTEHSLKKEEEEERTLFSLAWEKRFVSPFLERITFFISWFWLAHLRGLFARHFRPLTRHKEQKWNGKPLFLAWHGVPRFALLFSLRWVVISFSKTEKKNCSCNSDLEEKKKCLLWTLLFLSLHGSNIYVTCHQGNKRKEDDKSCFTACNKRKASFSFFLHKEIKWRQTIILESWMVACGINAQKKIIFAMPQKSIHFLVLSRMFCQCVMMSNTAVASFFWQ